MNVNSEDYDRPNASSATDIPVEGYHRHHPCHNGITLLTLSRAELMPGYLVGILLHVHDGVRSQSSHSKPASHTYRRNQKSSWQFSDHSSGRCPFFTSNLAALGCGDEVGTVNSVGVTSGVALKPPCVAFAAAVLSGLPSPVAVTSLRIAASAAKASVSNLVLRATALHLHLLHPHSICHPTCDLLGSIRIPPRVRQPFVPILHSLPRFARSEPSVTVGH